MAMSTTVPLRKPIKAHGEEVEELTLRDIGVKDIMELGTPLLIIPSADGKSAGMEIREAVIGRYISRLAKVPMSSVEAIDPKDWPKFKAVVMGFFEESDGEETPAPSSD